MGRNQGSDVISCKCKTSGNQFAFLQQAVDVHFCSVDSFPCLHMRPATAEILKHLLQCIGLILKINSQINTSQSNSFVAYIILILEPLLIIKDAYYHELRCIPLHSCQWCHPLHQRIQQIEIILNWLPRGFN